MQKTYNKLQNKDYIEKLTKEQFKKEQEKEIRGKFKFKNNGKQRFINFQ